MLAATYFSDFSKLDKNFKIECSLKFVSVTCSAGVFRGPARV